MAYDNIIILSLSKNTGFDFLDIFWATFYENSFLRAITFQTKNNGLFVYPMFFIAVIVDVLDKIYCAGIY